MTPKFRLMPICWSLLSALTLANAVAASAAIAPETTATPLPRASNPPANPKFAGASKVAEKAPHLISAGRKSFRTYGYMKQASDDRDGLSRLQDQARQLSPPR